MPQKIYIVDLTEDERSELRDLIKKGKPSARKVARAHILLLADEGVTDKAIAAALHVGTATVERTHKRFVEGNLARALNEDPRPGRRSKFRWPAGGLSDCHGVQYTTGRAAKVDGAIAG